MADTRINKGETAIRVKRIYQEAKDELLEDDQGKLLASHIGGFSQDFIYTFCDEFELLLVSHGDSRVIIKRIFSILIEGLQNIRIHGKKDDFGRQTGFLIIVKHEAYYKVLLGNLIDNKDSENLIKYLEKINSYSEKELKQTYLEILRNEFMSHSKGAGLGFITTRLKSGSQFGYKMYPVDQKLSLFTFSINVMR